MKILSKKADQKDWKINSQIKTSTIVWLTSVLDAWISNKHVGDTGKF